MTDGSSPATAKSTISAIGANPNSFAFSSDITTTAAPPSFNPDALPAVTLPSFSKAGLSLAKSF